MNQFNPNTPGATVALREFLAGFFNARNVASYYFEAPETATFPYIVYELRSIDSLDDSDTSRRHVLEINAYTDGAISQLDNLLDFLESEMNGYIHRGEILIEIHLGFGRIDVADKPDIKRKRALFDLNYWPKED